MSPADWIGISNIALTLVIAVGGVIVLLLRRNADGTSERIATQGDKQVEQGETLADVAARVGAVEATQATLADAVERITRLEEWRVLSSPRIAEGEATARAVVALGEQNKSIFKELATQGKKIDDLPRQTVEMLKGLIRPVHAQGRV